MPALNFQERFAEDVELGRKRQTIRKKRRFPVRPGDRLALFAGMRTKGCRRLREARCVDVKHVSIGREAAVVDGVPTLDEWERDEFARADGFVDWAELVEWFEMAHGLPFRGVLIKW